MLNMNDENNVSELRLSQSINEICHSPNTIPYNTEHFVISICTHNISAKFSWICVDKQNKNTNTQVTLEGVFVCSVNITSEDFCFSLMCHGIEKISFWPRFVVAIVTSKPICQNSPIFEFTHTHTNTPRHTHSQVFRSHTHTIT